MINDTIHNAAKEAGIVPTKNYKPKPHWCPNLAYFRDKKRFWWTVWVSAGKPYAGVIYDCHKLAKKAFRHESRQSVQRYSDRNTFKLNDMYR